MIDANEISRAYIARQTAHRTGAAFEVSPPRRGVNPWRVAGLALAVLPNGCHTKGQTRRWSVAACVHMSSWRGG